MSGTGNYAGFNNGLDVGGEGTAWAQLNDVLHFTVPGATSSTVTTIGVMFTVQGGISLNGAPPSDNGETGGVSTSLQFGNGNVATSANYTGTAATPLTVTENTPTGWASYTESPSSTGAYAFTGEYTFTGSTADIPVQTSMLAYQCQLTVDCAFADTGAISLVLPTGVTYTSDSGVFLTQPASEPQSAPEPGSLLLLTTSLGLVAMRRRG